MLLAASSIMDFFYFYSLCSSSTELFPDLPLYKFWASLLTAHGDLVTDDSSFLYIYIS